MMQYLIGLWKSLCKNWPIFWFQPRGGETLAVLRIATGLMLAYMHFVWLIGAKEFFGPDAMINRETNLLLHQNDYTWSYLRYTDSLSLIWAHQLVLILVSLAMAAGLLLKFTAPLAWFMTLMVCHRATGHLFGLDQVTMMLAFGLAFAYVFERRSVQTGRGGARWLQHLRLVDSDHHQQSIYTFASRLIQLQLCAMYLFGGLGKMRGSMWWDGSAIWFAAASYEYQSVDMTWIGYSPFLQSMIAHATIAWETFYCITIWPKWSRPLTIAMAIVVHLSIAVFLGMITFGLMMIVANLAFIRPEAFRKFLPGARPETSQPEA